MHRYVRSIGPIALALSSVSFGQGGLFDLETLGGPDSRALDVSADGSVVVGRAQRANGDVSAFAWSLATGMIDIGTGMPTGSEARGVNADGRFAFGNAGLPFATDFAFLWSRTTGFQRIPWLGGGAPPTFSSVDPVAISADGGVLVGSLYFVPSQSRAFRWTRTGGTELLGALGSNSSQARAVSADGSVVVGFELNAANQFRAFRWTAATGIVDLGTLGGNASDALAVNADGSVVVGNARDAQNRQRAFRWTAATGMVDLGTLGGAGSTASCVTPDGMFVAGFSAFGPSSAQHAFRWSMATGMQDLGTNGGLQSFAFAISDDGRVVAGQSPSTGNQDQHTFRWSEGSGMLDIGTLGAETAFFGGMSADGSVLVGHSYRYLPTVRNRAFRWELGATASIGFAYCSSAAPNSTGVLGSLEARGNNALSANGVSLVAGSLPLQSFGYFLASRTQGSTPFAGGSLGTLCLAGAIGRFVGPGQVQSSGSVGSFQLPIDLSALPQPSGSVAAMLAESWNFQAWHRDSVGGSPVSNYTNAVVVSLR